MRTDTINQFFGRLYATMALAYCQERGIDPNPDFTDVNKIIGREGNTAKAHAKLKRDTEQTALFLCSDIPIEEMKRSLPVAVGGDMPGVLVDRRDADSSTTYATQYFRLCLPLVQKAESLLPPKDEFISRFAELFGRKILISDFKKLKKPLTIETFDEIIGKVGNNYSRACMLHIFTQLLELEGMQLTQDNAKIVFRAIFFEDWDQLSLKINRLARAHYLEEITNF